MIQAIRRRIDGIKREWAMLRSYRRPHVFIHVHNCVVYGTLDLADVAMKLSDPRITRVSRSDGDISISIESCCFEGDGKRPGIQG